MSTAYDHYWAALDQQDLPAAVPVADNFCHEGIATATFDVTQNPEVTAGCSSPSWRKRAEMAIYACAAAREGIDAEHPELHSS